MACSTCASAKCPIRHLAMTGMVTAAIMPSIMSGSLIRATPPCARMSAGTRSSAITATAPASSAILAWSGVTTSMITPPLSISAMPRLTRAVPVSGPVLSTTGPAAGELGLTSAVDTSKTSWDGHVLASMVCRPRRGAVPPIGSNVALFDALAGDGVVHVEELRLLRAAGQVQHLGQRAAARVDRAAGQFVVELAGDQPLLRGRLDLGDEFGRAIFPGEPLAEIGVAKGGAQQAGQVGLGQVALRGPDLPGAAD